MITDPKVRALIDGGPGQFLTRRQKVERVAVWVIAVAVVVLGAGYFVNNSVAHQAQDASAKAAASVQASCGFWHDLAVLPPTSKSTVTLYRIIADSYVAYAGLDCVGNGGRALPAPSADVVGQIPPGLRTQVLNRVH